MLQIADLNCDMLLLEEAQSAARELLAGDDQLTAPEHRKLRERIDELFEMNAEGLN